MNVNIGDLCTFEGQRELLKTFTEMKPSLPWKGADLDLPIHFITKIIKAFLNIYTTDSQFNQLASGVHFLRLPKTASNLKKK